MDKLRHKCVHACARVEIHTRATPCSCVEGATFAGGKKKKRERERVHVRVCASTGTYTLSLNCSNNRCISRELGHVIEVPCEL